MATSGTYAFSPSIGETKDLFAYAEDNRLTIIYRALNLENGKSYIGISRLGIERRAKAHLNRSQGGSRTHFHNAIRRYGLDAFVFEEIGWCPTYQDALKAERDLIKFWKPEYNKTQGGEGITGHRHNAESRAKMSAAKKGKPPPWTRGQCPDDVRAKLSAARRGKKMKPSAKMAEASKRTARIGNEARRKPVICLTDGKAYRSVSEAANAYGLDRVMMTHYCRGRFKPKGGLSFSYITEAGDGH